MSDKRPLNEWRINKPVKQTAVGSGNSVRNAVLPNAQPATPPNPTAGSQSVNRVYILDAEVTGGAVGDGNTVDNFAAPQPQPQFTDLTIRQFDGVWNWLQPFLPTWMVSIVSVLIGWWSPIVSQKKQDKLEGPKEK